MKLLTRLMTVAALSLLGSCGDDDGGGGNPVVSACFYSCSDGAFSSSGCLGGIDVTLEDCDAFVADECTGATATDAEYASDCACDDPACFPPWYTP